jgi:hypothetical protein
VRLVIGVKSVKYAQAGLSHHVGVKAKANVIPEDMVMALATVNWLRNRLGCWHLILKDMRVRKWALTSNLAIILVQNVHPITLAIHV